jgi:hypothetical protein
MSNVMPVYKLTKKRKRLIPMDNLVFDSGIKEFSINNDETKIIRFNPGDPNQFKTIKEIYVQVEALRDKFTLSESDLSIPESNEEAIKKLEENIELVDEADRAVREIIDTAFKQPICDTVFGTQNIWAVAGGKHIWENFIDALAQMCSAEMEKKTADIEQHTAKYVVKYSSPKIEEVSSPVSSAGIDPNTPAQ